MTARDEITRLAEELVKELVVNNKAGYSGQIGPVVDPGSGAKYGTYRVLVERVEDA